MAALNFPNSPSLNDTHTENGVTFKWNGAAWDRLGDIGAQGSAGAAGAQGAAGAAGAQGSTGPVAGSSTQVVYKDGSNNPAGSANFTFDGTNLTVSGNVSIGGTLTYEDVTNIDSVGIITARLGIKVPDSQKVFLGADNDLQIYHDGSHSYVQDAGTGNLILSGTRVNLLNPAANETMVSAQADGPVELYYDNSLKLSTAAGGVNVAGNINLNSADNYEIRLGAANDLKLYHNATNSYIQNNTGVLFLRSDGGTRIQDTGGNEMHLKTVDNGAVELYYDGSKKFETTSTGVKIDNSSTTDMLSFDVGGTNFAKIGHNSASGTNILDVRSEGHTRFLTGGNNERLRIDSNGRVLISGQAALTSTSLSHPIQVTAASDADAIAIIGRAADDISELSFYEADKTTNLGEIQYRQDHVNFRHRVGYISFATGGVTERLRITSGGNVGINDTAPSQKLNVGGNIMLEGNDQYMYLTNVGTGNAGIYVRGRDSTSELRSHSTGMFTWEVTGSEKMRLDSSGRVMIGTQTVGPTAGEQLTIANSANAGITIRSGTTAAGSILFEDNTADRGEIQYSHNGDYMRFKTAGTERVRITSAGNVGINETSPATHLHVEQDNAHSSTYYLNTDAAILVDNKNASGRSVIKLEHDAAIVWGGSGSSILFSDRESERMRIDSSGRLGINDTSPNKLLTVNRGSGSDGDLVDFKNDEVSLRFGVWGTGATYPRQCTINATRQDGGTYPWLRLAGQDGIHFCSDLNNIRGNLNAYGEWRIGTSSGNLHSTDQVHSIGNLNFGVSSNLARLNMQERQGNWISFKDGSSNHYGTISRNGSGVSYGSNSDYRLKDNVQNFTSGIELVKRLRPVTFNWNALSGQEDTTTIHRGFLAHEVQEIEPGAVDGEKDGMDRVGDCTNAEGVVTQKNVYESQAKDGETWTLVSEEIKDQQLDPAKLVPILTAGLKEAIAKIETLEAAVAALQGS